MVIELKDSAGVVVHNKFYEWRKRNPRGMFLSLKTKTKANLHGVPCHHAGTYKWYPGSSSLTKKLKVLEDGPVSLQKWASDRGIRIHVCIDCRSKGYIIDHGKQAKNNGDETRDGVLHAKRAQLSGLTEQSAFLLSWNPKRFDWDVQDDITDIRKKGYVTRRWSCGNRKELPKGSEIFLIRLGTEPKGIVGRGIAVSKATEGTHWEVEKRRQKIKGWNVDVRITELSERPIVPWDVLERQPLSGFRWSIQASGIKLPPDILDALHSSWPASFTESTKGWDSADHPLAEDIAIELSILNDASLSTTVKESVILARRGQGRFRNNVLHADSKCRLTGITDPDHLIASHIKPWKVSTNNERVSGDNGLMLGPHIDHLFDKGYIGFTDMGNLLVSPKCQPTVLTAWGISRSVHVRPFRPAQRPFLEYHRRHVLLRE